MSWKFWKKREEILVPYIPQGRIGCRRLTNVLYESTIIVEEIGRIGNRVKIKILDVSIDRDCNKTKEQILKWWGVCDWVPSNSIAWENEEQKHTRLTGTPMMAVLSDVTQPEKIEYRLTPHTLL